MVSKNLRKVIFLIYSTGKKTSPIRPSAYYNPNSMSPKDKEVFMAWHASKKESNYIFNFQEETVAYRCSDVDILRRCCLEFRELFHNVTHIDPFTTLTIASACHLVYRTNYLPKDTIAIILPLGYCPKNNRCLPINGFRTRPKRTKPMFNMRVTVARNVLAPTCSTGNSYCI